MERRKGRTMRKKNSDQMNLNLQSPSPVSHSSASEAQGKRAVRIYCLEEAQKKREQIEERKHVKAILDLVRHYK